MGPANLRIIIQINLLIIIRCFRWIQRNRRLMICRWWWWWVTFFGCKVLRKQRMNMKKWNLLLDAWVNVASADGCEWHSAGVNVDELLESKVWLKVLVLSWLWFSSAHAVCDYPVPLLLGCDHQLSWFDGSLFQLFCDILYLLIFSNFTKFDNIKTLALNIKSNF